MRYYFHLRNCSQFILDRDGIELANLDEVHAQVSEAVGELCNEEPEVALDSDGWSLDVSDFSGAVLLSISVGGRTRH